MDYIHVKLLGNFIATFNGKSVSFPYSKVQALFCYLVIKKQTTRDELSGLLWPDMEESTARKNLRNAIYKLKKVFGKQQVIDFLNKSTIIFNENTKIDTDVEKFINNEDEVDIYQGQFLKSFMPKGAENFEKWMCETREYLEGIYLKRLKDQIKVEENRGNNEKIEKYCKLIIKTDEFNEEAYRQLIYCYKNQRKFNNAIELYNKLSDILNKELAIVPDIKTTKAFNEVLDLMNERHKSESNESYFYGRLNELRLMENNYYNFIKGNSSKSMLIKGEMGIGKTSLKDRFLETIDKNKIYVFETNCYQFESEYALKPWRNIISRLACTISDNEIKTSDTLENIIKKLVPEVNNANCSETIKLEDTIELLKHDVVGNIITYILKKVSIDKKILLVFEDIQWMDSASVSLLTSIMSKYEGNNIMFLLTFRNEFNHYVDRFLASTKKYDKIQIIELNRFSTIEVENFINKVFPKHNLSKEIINKIYRETEGNAFFIKEYLNIIKSKNNINIITSKMQDVLKNRFMDISGDEKKIVEIASLFHDEVPLFILKELTQKDELEIMDIIEKLEGRFILKESKNQNDICFKFTHQKLREFQYMNLSQAKKRILHNKTGQILEKTLKNNTKDINIYYKLIYHFENAHNFEAALKYRIKNLNVYLNFSHELFPIIYYNNKSYDELYFNDSESIKNLKEIEHSLEKLRSEEGNSDGVLKLEVSVLHIKGRYLIRKGEYEEGIKNIQDMICKANDIKYTDYAIEGYKQMIYYCIQTNKTEEMIKYINCGLEIAVSCNYYEEVGIILRLKALYKKMVGDYEEAQTLMQQSINTLSGTKNTLEKYALNIAACYNYMGDIRKKKENFLEALDYYNKAIEICEQKNVLTSLALFYTNAGETAFCISDYSLSTKYFKKALNIYKKFDIIWGKSIAEAFMSIILMKDGNFEESLKFLKNADVNSKILKNPKEIGTVFRAKAEILLNVKDNTYFEHIFGGYLNEDFQEYVNQGIIYLKEARDEYSANALKRLKN
ncbi:AAA family ATPase [Clostridium sp. P21]|uniref:AAA family ATPase n=1 Tax=Clostridium muellerianum TaxID=2716538 RepID=A0A7Y0EGB7_9CLOT|nr:AAA family ATPase [Clostridium muellerianum]NMM62871.1 AAA family ATPase [Clostridium muellerianum]